jgi:FimV-like protein
MNKLLSLIVIILFITYIPLGPVDYSSKLAGIFIFLEQLQLNLSNTINMFLAYTISLILVVFDNALPVLSSLYKMALSLPYGEINYLYVLIALIVVSFFSEKFRTINNELNKIRKRISTYRKEDKSTPVNNTTEEINSLNQKAVAILELLTEINNAAKSIKNNYARSKKIRRANSAILSAENSAIKTSLAKDEDKLMRLRKDQTLQENKVDIITEVNNDDVIKPSLAKDEDRLMRLRKDQTLQENKSDEIMSDENISQIDLARAFIESNEKEDAINLIKKIIDTGTEEEKHEAKLLYMQVK